MNDLKFTYLGEEYNLTEIVGESELFTTDDGKTQVITKKGIVVLLNHFPDIDYRFDTIQQLRFSDTNVLSLHAEVFNIKHPELRTGRSFGEVSIKNSTGFHGEEEAQYPVAILENRARNRAIIRHFGIPGLFSEEESPDFSRENITNSSTNGVDDSIDIVIQKKCEELNVTTEDLHSIYCTILKDDSLTEEDVSLRATKKVKEKVLKELESKS